MRWTDQSDLPKTIDEYLEAVPKEPREALARVRRIVKATAPDATESISYQMPVFKYQGLLVGFAAFKNHLSFFPMSKVVMKANKSDLKRFDTAEGTIRFTVDRQLPEALIRKLVRARMKENEEKVKKRELKAKQR